MVYVQCITHAVSQSVVSVVISSIFMLPCGCCKNWLNLDNIDEQPTCMHFSRARGGLFFKKFDDYVFDMIAVTVRVHIYFKYFIRYSFLVRSTPYNNLTKR